MDHLIPASQKDLVFPAKTGWSDTNGLNGAPVGCSDGVSVGEVVGCSVGSVGESVGLCVGHEVDGLSVGVFPFVFFYV